MYFFLLNDKSKKEINFDKWLYDKKKINNIIILFNKYLFIKEYNACLKIINLDKINYIKFKIYSKNKLKLIDRGKFGKIYLNEKKDFVIKKTLIEDLFLEFEILKKINYTFTISLIDYFEFNNNSFIVLEYLSKGNLLKIIQKYKLKLNEIIFYISEVICAIEYLHSMNIIYMDLKPENIMIQHDGHIKLIDFGLSSFNNIIEIGGTTEYMSPEVLKCLVYETNTNTINEMSDIWCIGILLFELSYNDIHEIIYKKNDIELLKIYKNELWWFKIFDINIIDLLFMILKYNSDERATINEIKNHVIFNNIDWSLIPKKFYKSPY